ncbi:hypothetical protein GCM10023331_07060 [Algivirga pacifica]|uniref:Uncharacterized protein n=1 Tax=Algivirga pacifica TaxID=1162670 RepID=A0ABP9D1I9_9BACT
MFHETIERMQNKYIWIVIEFATIIGGTFITVLNGMDSRSTNLDTAFGASLIVLGIMIRLWRREFLNSKKI